MNVTNKSINGSDNLVILNKMCRLYDNWADQKHMLSDFQQRSTACGPMITCFIIAQIAQRAIQNVYSQLAYCAIMPIIEPFVLG